jgi:hypothetical protein
MRIDVLVEPTKHMLLYARRAFGDQNVTKSLNWENEEVDCASTLKASFRAVLIVFYAYIPVTLLPSRK